MHIDFFARYKNCHILTTITDPKGNAFVNVDDEYFPIWFEDTPYIYEVFKADIDYSFYINLCGKKNIQFLYVIPLVKEDKIYSQPTREALRDHISKEVELDLVLVPLRNVDRLRFKGWTRDNPKNVRFDILHYNLQSEICNISNKHLAAIKKREEDYRLMRKEEMIEKEEAQKITVSSLL
jgi:hypothetical protein